MAKTLKKYIIELQKDSDGIVTARGYVTVGSSDDVELSKASYKNYTLSTADQADADTLYSSLEGESKTDEGIT